VSLPRWWSGREDSFWKRWGYVLVCELWFGILQPTLGVVHHYARALTAYPLGIAGGLLFAAMLRLLAQDFPFQRHTSN